MLRNLIKKTVPAPIVESIKRNLVYGFSDLVDTLTGKREELVPPKRMIFIGGVHFKKVGDEFLGYFKNICDLRSDASVLDVGSGIGRMARPLTGFLSKSGHYEGFDIDIKGVDWCRKNITPKFSNFKFQRADIYNKFYNPSGKSKSSEYQFPFPNNTFDFTFLTSVFTHMFPADVDNYLKEISRTLKPGGKTLITFFLSNPESLNLISEKKSAFAFQYEMDGYLTTDREIPENAICLKETFVRELYKKHGLNITSIRYGKWSGREDHLSFQDMVFAEKPV